jgi:serine/threonine protein kinase
LVHRDIKPSNIIFVHGQPKFADIGLVTDISEKATCVGTEGYIPPEGPGSATADLYSLGKVIYQIAMGKGPEEFPELATNIRELPEASALMGLNQIILKACDRTASKRFQSGEQMFEALTRLAGQELGSTRRGTGRPGSLSGLAITILNTSEVQPNLRLALVLQERLATAGHNVWIDRHQTIDMDWARDVEKRIEHSDIVIVLLSALSVRCEMLAYEIELAHQSSQSRKGKPRLVPIRVQFAGKLPRQISIVLGSTSCLSWDRPEEDQRLVDEIVRASES